MARGTTNETSTTNNTKGETMTKSKEEADIQTIKEIGSDPIRLADFFSKLSVYIYMTTNSTKTKIEFTTTPTTDKKVFVGKFTYKEK
jgi:hypothetical protein